MVSHLLYILNNIIGGESVSLVYFLGGEHIYLYFECFIPTYSYPKHISPAIPPINRVIILGFHTNSILVGISILNIGIREPKFVEEEKEGEEALV